MFGYSIDDFRRFCSHAWRFLALFSLLYCFLYCMRLNLSNAGAAMVQSLGMGTDEFGLLTGAMFWTYGAGQLVNGRLSEVLGRRNSSFCRLCFLRL